MQNNLPPVIVFNLSYTGIGIIRHLKGTGVPVFGMTSQRKLFGNFSKHCELRYTPDSELEADQLFDYLVSHADEHGGAVIFPTRDLDIAFLDKYRVKLEAHYRVGIPPHDALQALMDKSVLARVAAEAGVPIPRTAVARCEADLSEIADKIGFPCVVKPTKSLHWREYGQWEKMGAQKAVPIKDSTELREAFVKAAKIHAEVLIQELIPGSSSELASACAYIGSDGEAKAYFTAGILLKYPDHLGTGCLVENRDIPELREPTLRILRILGYRGVADAEYKRDPRDGVWKLIEINTRHWDWHEIGGASGASMTRAAYEDFVGIPIFGPVPALSKVKWINEESLFFYLAGSIYRGKLSIREAARQLSGRRIYGVFDWEDLRPFLWWTVFAFVPSVSRRLLAVFRRT